MSDSGGLLPGVTRREAEVLAALGERLTNREIATRLCVSERTVESHVSALLRKLDAGNRLELAARASALALQGLGPSDVAVPLPSIIEALAARSLVGPTAAAAEDALAPRRQRRVVWVRGPAGIGKTRLLAEIARNAHAGGAVVLYGHFDEQLGAPYQGVRDALRYWVTSVPTSTVRAVAGVWLPQLASLVPEAVAEPGDRRQNSDRHTLFEAVDALLSRVSVASPLVLLLDDLHCAETASLLLLRHLARSTRNGRLTIVGAYRDTDVGNTHPLFDVVADLHRDSVATSVDVAPLDTEALTLLVDDLGVVPSGAVPVVVAKSGGNPFFALELARHLADTDQPAASVPAGVRAVVRQRLGRLSPAANEALRVAAIVGPEFGESVVEAAGTLPARDLRDALDDATGAHLLEEVPGTIGRYRFTHDLVRQAIAEELTNNARVRLHWAAGAALATFEPAGRAAIAYHLSEGVLAGDVATAADALLAAAAEARETAAWERAAEASVRCVALLDDTKSDDPDRRYQALIGAYRGYRALGAYREARAACDGAIDIARRSGRSDYLTEAVLGRTVWRVYRRTSEEPDYLDLIDDALATLAAGDSVDRAMLLARRARVIEMQAASEDDIAAAVEHAEAGLAMAQRVGDPAALLEAHDAFAQVVVGKLAPTRYLELARAAIQVAEAIPPEMLGEDIVLLGRVTNRLAAAGRLMADPDAFAEGFTRTERLAEVTGIPHTRAMVLRLRAGESLAQGRLNEAVELADAMVATCGHDLNFLNTAWEVKLMAALVAGRLDDVVSRLRTSTADTHSETREMTATLALALAATEVHDEASTSIAALIDDGLPWTWARPRALWAAAETAARLDDRALAATLRPLLDVHSGSLLSPYAATCTIDGAADTSIGLLDTVLGHFDHAMPSFSAGLALEERMGYEALAARTRSWWAWALARRGRADDLKAATELRTAADAAARRLGLGLVQRHLIDSESGRTVRPRS